MQGSNEEKYRRPQGSISMVMHKGGNYNPETGQIEGATEIIDTQNIKNLIVNSASQLMASRMAPLQVSETGY